MRVASVVAVVALLALPAATLAQDVPGNVEMFPFQPMAGISMVALAEWYGIGGTAGAGGGAQANLAENQEPATDACADFDNSAAIWGNLYVALPSFSQKVIYQETTTVAPATSTPAPPELIALCAMVREQLFGQPTGHAYADDPQSIGHGDVTFEADTFALMSGVFDDALRAFPPSLGALLCEMTNFRGTEAQGDEVFGGTGFDNGVLLADAAVCISVRDEVLDAIESDDPLVEGEWDPGYINRQGGASLWDLSLWETDRVFGLHALCLKATVFNDVNAVVGSFEDYGYFWVDGPENAYALAPNWSMPANSDGRALSQECSTIGIPL